MSDDNFVSRWSRLKRESAQRRKVPLDTEVSDTRPGAAREEPGAEVAGEARKPEPELDLASLPPIDSIVSGSDIGAFLQKGVPAELTKAALRRAWTSDPAIRDFIGLAENQWDFTDPTAIPGFGALEATDNVGQLVAQAMGKVEDVSDAVGLSEEPQEGMSSEPDAPDVIQSPSALERKRSVEAEQPVEVAAAQYREQARDSDGVLSRRGHGRALPK
jgi:hypothetical protein